MEIAIVILDLTSDTMCETCSRKFVPTSMAEVMGPGLSEDHETEGEFCALVKHSIQLRSTDNDLHTGQHGRYQC